MTRADLLAAIVRHRRLLDALEQSLPAAVTDDGARDAVRLVSRASELLDGAHHAARKGGA